MKTWFRVALFVLLALPIGSAFAQTEFPLPTGVVNDFADILSETSEQEITAIIEEIEEKTSAEVAVVTINSLEGYDPNYYAVELGRAWGVGTAERDDGVVFLTAVEDREVYIATGYGVEGYITDAQAFWITDKVVVPYFRESDYEGGILAGVQEIKRALVDLEKLPDGSTSENVDWFDSLFEAAFWFIIFLGFVLPWLTAVLARSKRWWPGGVVGAILGVILIVFFSVTIFIILPFTIIGFLTDYFASKNYKKGKDSFWTGGGRSGWGGGSSFGGGSSSSSSSGGFSGGSFGGGGGGSSW